MTDRRLIFEARPAPKSTAWSCVAMAMIVTALALALGACSAQQVAKTDASVDATLTTAQADLLAAQNFYGIAKGIAQVGAAVAQPAVATQINAALAKADTVSATATQALSGATTDAATIEALAASLNSQAIAIQAVAAPLVKVTGHAS